MIRPELPSLDELKRTGEPRVHPNGFMQIDLTAIHRLHVWHPLLPYRQKTYSQVHDHVFDFNSFVYAGRLINVMYSANPDSQGTHEWWQVQDIGEGNSTVLAPKDNTPRVLQPIRYETTQPGQCYFMPSYKFHESVAGEPTITIIEKVNFLGAKTGANCEGASVMVRRGEQPDNEFRRDAFDTEVLWRLIEDSYGQVYP